MNRKVLIFTILMGVLLVWCSRLAAQIAVGDFRTHLSYFGVHSVTASPDYVYAASDNGVIFYDRATQAVDTWTKVEGLSETGISSVFYDEDSRYLIVVYKNANLDFIRDGQLTNLPDIYNKTMTGEKSINYILPYNHLLYLGCSFGIVIIDPTTLLIQDTWYTQAGTVSRRINSMQVFDDQFFILTDNGIYHTPVASHSQADFSTWQRVYGLPMGDYQHSCVFDGRLYVTCHFENEVDTLLMFDGSAWLPSQVDLSTIRALDVNDDQLLVASWSFAQIYDASEQMLGYFGYEGVYQWQNVQDACLDGNLIWFADANNGLMQMSQDWSVVKLHEINGPYSRSSYRMDYCDGKLVMVPGAISSAGGKIYLTPDLSCFSNEQWTNAFQMHNPSLAGAYDLASVAINPRNSSEIYAGLFEGGVVKYRDYRVEEIFNRSNSNLVSFDSADAYVGGLCFDGYGNLWISSSYSSRPLTVLKSDGTWKSFPLSAFVSGYNTLLTDIMVDSRGWKWVLLPRANTIVVFDDNNTIDNVTDDHAMSVNMNAAATISTSSVNCVVEDKKGEIWIGCNLGVKVIYNPSQIFSGGVYPQNILVEQINYVQNLFEFEEVTAIAVDDANRKWVGTAKSGVFLISPNGDKQLLHFNTDNSPLLSNRINHITIQRQTGEVFFATADGIVSYRGTATEGTEDYSEVTVFPNPVRETYNGVITVSGLKENSFCKVADAAGNLVWQDYANGGTFTWNGRDFNGKRPATGVYFVFASDKDGKKKAVAKILFVH